MKLALSAWPVLGLGSFFDFQKKILTAPEADIIVFPEYFSLELSTIRKGPWFNFFELVEFLAGFQNKFLETIEKLSKDKNAVVVGGTFPVYENGKIYNRAYVFHPQKGIFYYDKKILTPWEREWGISSGERPAIILKDKKVALQICYEIEFPLLARKLLEEGAEILLVPSTTETFSGAKRVQIGSAARALENQMAVAVAVTQGKAPFCFGLENNTGWPAIYLPPDASYSAKGRLSLKKDGFWRLGILDLEKLAFVRQSGETRNAQDWFLQKAH